MRGSGTPLYARGAMLNLLRYSQLIALAVLFAVVVALSLLFGVLLILPIGGADMPVVISLYNALTGLAVAFEGFVLDNAAMIIAGTVVGAAGSLLTQLMAKAMNRSLANVLFSGLGTDAAQVGARGVTALYERYGARGTAAHIAAYLDFTEKRFRAAIDRLPPGRYEAEDFLDGDHDGETCRIRLALTVRKGQLDFDFAGSDPQLASARNIPYRALLATVYTVAKSLLDPEVPANAGYYRTMNISAPPGCVVGPTPPATLRRARRIALLAGRTVAGLRGAVGGGSSRASCRSPRSRMLSEG